MNKKGETAIIIFGVFVVISLTLIILGFIANADKTSLILEGLPDVVTKVVNSYEALFTPIVKVLFFVVAPAGENENVQMIAFALFLLISFVGFYSLKSFFGRGITSLVISMVVGIIVGRSLTATILEKSALAASPLTAISLLIGFIPVFTIAQGVDKLWLTNASKLGVYFVVGLVYMVFFGMVFNVWLFGSIYMVAIWLLGFGQILIPFWKKNQNRKLGEYMAHVQKTIVAAEEMREGARRAERS